MLARYRRGVYFMIFSRRRSRSKVTQNKMWPLKLTCFPDWVGILRNSLCQQVFYSDLDAKQQSLPLFKKVAVATSAARRLISRYC